jgi:hypothetical protein
MPPLVVTSTGGVKRSATPLGRALGGKPGGECHYNCVPDPSHVPLARPAAADCVLTGWVEKVSPDSRRISLFRVKNVCRKGRFSDSISVCSCFFLGGEARGRPRGERLSPAVVCADWRALVLVLIT